MDKENNKQQNDKKPTGKICRKKQLTKTKTVRKRKRVFNGTQRYAVNNVNIEIGAEDVVNNVPAEAPTADKNEIPPENINTTVSDKKVQQINFGTPSRDKGISGYRYMDMHILNNVISLLSCPDCVCVTLELLERKELRKDFASALQVHCKFCNYTHDFYSSASPEGQSFDVNKRTIYAMRACGQGYTGLERFTSLMDMPSAMTNNNYDKMVQRFTTTAKEVAEETMQEAAQEIIKENNNTVYSAVYSSSIQYTQPFNHALTCLNFCAIEYYCYSSILIGFHHPIEVFC